MKLIGFAARVAILTLFAVVPSFGADPRAVKGPLVTSDNWPRSTDLVSWTSDVMRIERLENASETAQAKAFFEWMRLFSRMAVGGMIQSYEGEYGKERYVTDAHKQLFVYGWGYCDTTSRIAEAAWKEFKRDPLAAERVCVQHADGGFHTMYRLRMDGAYGAFDPRYGYYLVEKDSPGARILDWAEVGRPGSVQLNQAFRNRSRPFFEIFDQEWVRAQLLQPVFFESEDAWRAAGAPPESVFADSAYQMGTKLHDMDFVLPRGTTIERFWDNLIRVFYVPAGKHTQRELPFLPAGRFYRVTEDSLGGNWVKHDPNYERIRPYLSTIPRGEGYPADLEGGKTIGQAWGKLRYQPLLAQGDYLDGIAGTPTLVHAKAVPYLRPARPELGGEASFEITCPYVLVDGQLEAELAGADTRIEMRVQAPKPGGEADAERWSDWQTLAHGAGTSRTELGRPRFNGKDASIHGAYRFQIRVVVDAAAGRKASPGLTALTLSLFFENGIMSIPRIQAGTNTIRFRVQDATALRAPVTVAYRYATAAGPREHTRTLQATEFKDNLASYALDAPDLQRCVSMSISY